MTCRQAVEKIINLDEWRISAEQEFELQTHLDICIYCHHFVKQNSMIDKALTDNKEIRRNLSDSEKMQLINSVKSRLDS